MRKSKNQSSKASKPFTKWWSDAERAYLLKLVEQHPSNFSEAFRIHAVKFNRTPHAVHNYFNRYRLAQEKNKGKLKVNMFTIGKNSFCVGRKNIYKGVHATSTSTVMSKIRRIAKILFE